MERRNRALKPIIYGAVIFLTLGITIANETLSRLGVEGNYIFLASVAFVLAAMLLGRKPLIIAVLILGVIGINLPEETLIQFHLDRDVMLAAVCSIILVPSIFDLMRK